MKNAALLIALNLIMVAYGMVSFAVGLSRGYSSGMQDGKDATAIYCNISPDYCKLALDRIEARPEQPALYKAMFPAN